MGFAVKAMTNRTRGFYALMGPWLSRRHVVADLGGPCWDDDTKQWWIAVDGSEVAGFCAATVKAGYVAWQSAYVAEPYRRQGVYRQLWTARAEAFPDRPVRATCTASTVPHFLANGFHIHRVRGAYTEVRNDA